MSPFVLKMAWRDSRGSRQRLVLYLSAMVLGVAALVAIQGFGENLETTVDAEAKTLLGADLSLESDRPFPDTIETVIDSIGGTTSRRISFASMALFPKNDRTRLATVRATEGDYPFYGEVVTRPREAVNTYRDEGAALVDGTLLKQFDAEVGDSIQIGRRTYAIAGELIKMPRESSIVSSISPRVYIPQTALDSTLLGRGSRAEYEVYFKFDDGRDVEALVASLEPTLDAYDVGSDTVDEAAGNWREGLGNLYRFLSLVGFVALLLGSLGVASAVNVYVRRRIESIAVLRCLGASGQQTFQVYLVQAAALGLMGSLIGAAIGVGIQMLVPTLLADFLPVPVEFYVSWRAILLGLGIGMGVTLLFALWPLLEVRGVSPMRALRSSVEPTTGGWTDPLRWAVAGAIGAGVLGFAMVQAPTWQVGLGYAGSLLVVFGLLAAVAWAIIRGVQRFFPSGWAYPWRQGLANLYRPQNQTMVLMLSLGLGTFLITTLFLVQQSLIEQIRVTGGEEGRPNLVLWDVQPDQLAGVDSLLRSNDLPVMEQTPIVTMGLESVKGRTIDDLRADSTFDLTFAHTREYRVTYRSETTPSETLVEGTLADSMRGNPLQSGAPVPVSIEADIANEDLNVGIGDTLTFDVQGVPVTAVIASVREVDWQRIGTNFFVVFPPGVLEKAPQIYAVLSRAPNDDVSASVQSDLVQTYPNVSAIDLSLVLSTFDQLFQRLSFVIRFMALFSIATGLIVLVSAVVVSRSQRAQESVLLKTLGASRSTVFRITAIEYLFLGAFAALTGLVLSLGATWALSTFVFEGPFVPDLLAVGGAFLIVTALTVGIGLLNSRGVYDRPPLDVLRTAEV
ncbi:ABC transporter permease [Longibacter sp.]|uniref:ABC transporter permease n=1 Tax=Longibacter sp. TaxID=2045415 RepID=UPI003EBB4982